MTIVYRYRNMAKKPSIFGLMFESIYPNALMARDVGQTIYVSASLSFLNFHPVKVSNDLQLNNVFKLSKFLLLKNAKLENLS